MDRNEGIGPVSRRDRGGKQVDLNAGNFEIFRHTPRYVHIGVDLAEATVAACRSSALLLPADAARCNPAGKPTPAITKKSTMPLNQDPAGRDVEVFRFTAQLSP